MENCYKKVEGFLDACGKFFSNQEDAWVSDAARELQKEHNMYLKNCTMGFSYRDHGVYKDMTMDQAERVVRKALELAQSKNCCS